MFRSVQHFRCGTGARATDSLLDGRRLQDPRPAVLGGTLRHPGASCAPSADLPPRTRASARSSRRPTAQLSRRSFLVGALGTAGAAAVLAACGTGSPSSTAQTAKDVSGTDKVVRWANWTQYLD